MVQVPGREWISVKQPSGGHKTPRYQTEEMHYEWRFERLCRYTARPPLATDRLEALPDGRLRYWSKTPWRDGTNHAVFEPLEFIEELYALVPPPPSHTIPYHEILAPP